MGSRIAGEVRARASAARYQARLVIEDVRFAENSGFDIFGDPIWTFDWLIRSHALGQVLPLPVDDDGAHLLEEVPLSVFSHYGNMAKYAAKCWSPSPPERALRAEGRVIKAVRRNDANSLKQAVAQGESLDSPSPVLGLRPLHLAAIRSDGNLLKLLLDLGANPNAADDRGQTPAGYVVVNRGKLELLAMLRSKGGSLDAVNDDGFGLLHAAAEVDRSDVVPMLVQNGLNLESRTKHGHTPLQIACALGHKEAATALLNAGADPLARTNGLTARDIAIQERKPQALEVLDRYEHART